MPNTDPVITRPTLTNPSLLASALHRIGTEAASTAEIWRRLTEHYIVDLDAVAALLPRAEPEPLWLTSRN
ncbi:hypothetical protein [Methylobacterium sp. J-090]|uniref:hypothetical protein n=1 Tax=Methylobacterium sp. J-090 TaxID=2836666 RepID=UPI001FBB8DDF|nr:hypothetical protein [Methylobacterium sp. J-090]MCJ2084099.1 hypothetical protein [Methylobacterium sp. J-090]